MSESPVVSHWTEHKATNGRIYWHNKVLKTSSWTKPDELKSRFEKLIDNSDWAMANREGKQYWYNKKTQQSVWEMPQSIREMKEKVDAEEKAEAERIEAERKEEEKRKEEEEKRREEQRKIEELKANKPSPMLAIGSVPGASTPNQSTPSIPGTPLAITNGNQQQQLVNQVTPVEAKLMLIDLFKNSGVDQHWKWEATMRQFITNPVWKLEPSLSIKKQIFTDYQKSLIDEEEAETNRRLEKLRPQFKDLLQKLGKVKPYSKWSTIKALIITDNKLARDKGWQNAKDDSERRMLFDEYLKNLQRQEEEEERLLRQRNLNKIRKYIETTTITIDSKWIEFKTDLKSSREWRNDRELQKIDMMDVLNLYEENLIIAERNWNDRRRKLKIEKKRDQRRKREGFNNLLKELVNDGKITLNTKWKEIVDDIKHDSRLIQIAGNAGSTPLELFFDKVDEFYQEVENIGREIEDEFVKLDKKMDENMTIDEFKSLIEKTNIDLKQWSIEDVYGVLIEKYKTIAREERNANERRRRINIDNLRSSLRYVKPVIEVDSKFEDALPGILELPEGKVLKHDEEGLKIAFEKFLKRLKERSREYADSDHSRRRRGDTAVRDKIRDERREERRRSRSPNKDDERESKRSRRDGSPEDGEIDVSK